MTPEKELALLRLTRGLAAQFGKTRDDERLLRRSLREARDFFEASAACLAVPAPDASGAVVHHTLPESAAWDPQLLAAFLRGERPHIPFNLLVAPIRRRRRTWAALVLRRAEREFERGLGWGLVTFAGQIGALLDRLDEERIRELRGRLDRKVMEQVRPHDLFYQVLDALRSITHYDHSSALFVTTTDGAALELVAEQLEWHKGGSRRIGLRIPVDERLRGRLGSEVAVAFIRDPAGWRVRDGADDGAAPLASLLDAGSTADGSTDLAIEREMLCAPIATRRGVIGVLKVSAHRRGLLGDFELDVLRQFAPHASAAIQYHQLAESLRGRMLEAERKSAIASIARGVAHDVNNALGSVLPLVQQIQADLAAGRLDAAQVRDDLRQVEEAVQYCRRIFRNMTSFAVPAPGRVGHANVRRAVDGTLAMLKTSLDRAAIDVEVEIADDLPHVRGVQGDLERLIFNLATNARDAMPQGGRLSVRARAVDGRVDLRVRDTGQGMPPEVIERIYEPGYSTKEEGSGIGLAVCRAIVWSSGGEISLESAPGLGTEVRVVLPAADGEGTA